MISKRFLLILIFLMCAGSIGYALFAQYHNSVTPCPLCIAQRIIIATTGVLALLFALHNPKSVLIRIYGLLIALISAFGIKVAAHHLWLTNLPADQQPLSCGMPLQVLYKRIPLNNFIGYVLSGDGECSKVNWTVLGMKAPTAVIVLFSIILLISVYVVFAKQKKTERRFV